MVTTMSTKRGYKRTEVGDIPEDWSVKHLWELGFWKGGTTPSMQNPLFWLHGSVPWIASGDVKSVHLEKTGSFITPVAVRLGATTLLPEKSIVIVTRSGILRKYLPVAMNTIPMAINQDIKALIPSKSFCPEFLLYALIGNGSRILSLCMKSGTTVESVEFQWLKEYSIPVPEFPEQEIIAKALGDIDDLISLLKLAVTKKRGIKIATMQKLLSGKKRLPGFTKKWKICPVYDLGQTYGGLSGKTKSDFGHGASRYIPFMNVMSDTVIDFEWVEPVDVSNSESQNLVKKGDLFFNGSSETPEEVGFCSVLLKDVPNLYLNSFCFGFRFKPEVKADGLFFAYWFRSSSGRKAMSILAQGSTRYNISKAAFLKMEILLPCEEEQAAISKVLSDMDADIYALETRLKKAKEIKQGMMQQLLTGNIRLI